MNIKNIFLWSVLAIAIIAGSIALIQTGRQQPTAVQQNVTINQSTKGMKITSPAFEHNHLIPDKYTCRGEEVSVPLRFSGVPEKTQSLALIMDDPDAPGGTWIHWLLWNIDPRVTEIKEGLAPAGSVQGLNSSGEAAYQGPCPPSGRHRYFFKLYALDTRLDLPAGARRAQLEEALSGHVVAQAELIGLYEKK